MVWMFCIYLFPTMSEEVRKMREILLLQTLQYEEDGSSILESLLSISCNPVSSYVSIAHC